MKRELGQFYTTVNPFGHIAFDQWFKRIHTNEAILEPFAGSGNIPELLSEIYGKLTWMCYDIHPVNDPEENTSGENIERLDTLQYMPLSTITITNPPYLAKNKAKRDGVNYPDPARIYTNLYLYALDKMLSSTDYLAAIIPDTFLLDKFDKSRLSAIIILNIKMFNDTEQPVCLALFNKNKSKDFDVWTWNYHLGKFSDLKKHLVRLYDVENNINIKFNDPTGNLGLIAIDKPTGKTIRFCNPNEIKTIVSDKSRNLTRISVDGSFNIKNLNNILNDFRNNTNDIFFASFKGLRKDGMYRRRMPFSIARKIIEGGCDARPIHRLAK